MSRQMSDPKKRPFRCAIYTRKSSEEGLGQEFNSLDAQRDGAEAYIESQRHDRWVALSQRYDDGGFTGGNMRRPALEKLLADIRSGQIDCVVVYNKVAILTRVAVKMKLTSMKNKLTLTEKRKSGRKNASKVFRTPSPSLRLYGLLAGSE